MINKILFPRKLTTDQAQFFSGSREERPWARGVIYSLMRMVAGIKQGRRISSERKRQEVNTERGKNSPDSRLPMIDFRLFSNSHTLNRNLEGKKHE